MTDTPAKTVKLAWTTNVAVYREKEFSVVQIRDALGLDPSDELDLAELHGDVRDSGLERLLAANEQPLTYDADEVERRHIDPL